ncbi:MAG: glycosyl hydrolase family 43, partial [Bacteroidales bacterium]|nr:glycosyl hydrolase family 43 [Bacteroidales bacterium]
NRFMKIHTILAFLLVTGGLLAQNPICPIGTYIADPTARVWADGKMYIYGST